MYFQKKTASVIFFIVTISSIVQLWPAYGQGKGNETGNRETPIPASSQALLSAIKENKSYKIIKKIRQCPSIITLSTDDSQYRYAETKIEKGQIPFQINGYEKDKGILSHRYFVHENNAFLFTPDKKEGNVKTIKSGCEFVMGIACRSDHQKTNKGSILFEGSAKILSVFMIQYLNSSLTFDSDSNAIIYTIRANGIDDIICKYAAAPEHAEEVKIFENHEKARRENPIPLSANDSDRSNVVKSSVEDAPQAPSAAKNVQGK